MLPSATFVLGGAASGKSRWAEEQVLSSGLTPVYLATSRVFDTEIEQKVTLHQARRDATWINIEADLDLTAPLAGCTPDQAVLIDCATMWLTNHLMDGLDVHNAQDTLVHAITTCRAPVVIVSNEVGHGIVPDNKLARRFREAQGRLNIALAAMSETAVLVTAGLPIVLKGTLP